jgi:LacI family transcriptional regulator
MVGPVKRVTIRDVADVAGLSPAAVSYALRGIMVSEETQDRVRRLADELGYEANPIARALASGRSGMIGILGPTLEDLWQQRLVVEAGRVLQERDRYALILDAGGSADRQRVLARQLRDQHVEGLIVSPVDPADPSWAQITAAVPVVVIGDTFAAATANGEVLYDNRIGVRDALEHLQALGHRRIAVLRPPGSPTHDRPAETIITAEAARLGLKLETTTAGYGLREATAHARGLLLQTPRPTAVFCFADAFAYGVYEAARGLGIGIPGELSVIGYDDHPISAVLSPPLTTFDWDSKRLMQTAVGMLLSTIEGTPLRHRRVVVAPELRERGSSAPPST